MKEGGRRKADDYFPTEIGQSLIVLPSEEESSAPTLKVTLLAEEYIDSLRDEIPEYLDVRIGCVNSPKSVTLTGPWSQLSRLEEWLKGKGIFARRLRVPIAYHHSRFMSAIADDYLRLIGSTLERGCRVP